MHHSRFCGFVIDCQTDDLDAAAAFWSKTLGHKINEPQADEPNYRDFDVKSSDPNILVQKVDHPSRVHLDIESDDLEAEAKRLEKIGAKRIGFVRRWIVMEAPTGHRFCIVNPQRDELTDANSNRWD